MYVQSPHKFTHSIIPYTRNIFIFFARVRADLPICFLPAIIEKYNNNQHSENGLCADLRIST